MTPAETPVPGEGASGLVDESLGESLRGSLGESLRGSLIEGRAAVAARVDGLEATLRELVLSRESANDDDEHDPEGVTLSSEWSRLSGLAEAARAELAETDAALGRWDAGTYGVCARCGGPIPIERLEVRPFATRCVPCASAAG